MIRRDRVVGVGNRDEVRNRGRVRVEVLNGCGSAARAREEVRTRDLAFVESDLTGGRVHRRGRRRRLVRDPEIDLVARVGVEVEAATSGAQVRERIRAGRDGLRLQRFTCPILRHLGGNDAAKVHVDIDDVDDPDLSRAEFQDAKRAAIAAAVQRQRGRTGLELEWVCQRLWLRLRIARIGNLEGRADCVVAGVQRMLLARPVHHLERELRCNPRLLGARGEQHAHAADRRSADCRPREVVLDDPVVRPSVLCIAEGAVLRHAEPMAPAMSADEEGRLRANARWRGLRAARSSATGKAERKHEHNGEETN